MGVDIGQSDMGVDIGQSGIGQTGIGCRLRGDLGQCAQNLRQDHPGVAPRAVQTALRQCRGHGRDVAGRDGRAGLGQRRTHGEQHVGAGVGVCHRENVEPVDLVGVAEQVTHCGMGPVMQGRCIQPAVRHRHLLHIPDTLHFGRQPSQIRRQPRSGRHRWDTRFGV